MEHYVEAEGEGDDEKGVPRQEEDEAFQHLTSEQHENKLSFKILSTKKVTSSREYPLLEDILKSIKLPLYIL